MSATTTTQTAVPPPTHKDSMRSTWRKHPEVWKIPHKLLIGVDGFPTFDDRPVPKHKKTDPVPYMPETQSNRWILFYAMLPMALQQAYVWVTGSNLNAYAALALYYAFYQINSVTLVRMLRVLGHKYGFFDGDQHDRDGVPDNNVTKTLMSLFSTVTLRMMLMVVLSYDREKSPITINLPWLFVEVGVYSVVLDFYFYWYHRCMHDIDSLWKYHRTHHLTKHPIALLSAFADEEQEFLDIVGIPFLTFATMRLAGFPMGFYEWWVCFEYVVFAEAFGHSGVRIHGCPPSSVSPLLRLVNCDLAAEDHDLHHRFGYKTSGNYGKQTRLWDRLFGTCKDRIETNIDYTDRVELAIFPWNWPALPPKISSGKTK